MDKIFGGTSCKWFLNPMTTVMKFYDVFSSLVSFINPSTTESCYSESNLMRTSKLSGPLTGRELAPLGGLIFALGGDFNSWSKNIAVSTTTLNENVFNLIRTRFSDMNKNCGIRNGLQRHMPTGTVLWNFTRTLD